MVGYAVTGYTSHPSEVCLLSSHWNLVPSIVLNGNNDKNSNKYISRAPNPSVSNLHEAPCAVHVQSKKQPNKETCDKKPATSEKKTPKKTRGWMGEAARSKH